MNDKKHQDLLLSIAQDFYLNKLSVSDLSAKYNVSRYYISKYLDEVVENNLVTIHINTPFARNAKMERKMMTEFSLKNVYIMKEKPDSITNEDTLVSFTAKVMQDLIASAHVVGISWGAFLYRVLDAFSQSDQRNLVFTQFVDEASKRRMYTDGVVVFAAEGRQQVQLGRLPDDSGSPLRCQRQPAEGFGRGTGNQGYPKSG